MIEKFVQLRNFLNDTYAVVVNGVICLFNQHDSNENEIIFDTDDGDDYYKTISWHKISTIEIKDDCFKVTYNNGDYFIIQGLKIKSING